MVRRSDGIERRSSSSISRVSPNENSPPPMSTSSETGVTRSMCSGIRRANHEAWTANGERGTSTFLAHRSSFTAMAVAIVVGASSGLGLEIGRLLEAGGRTVVGVSRRGETPARGDASQRYTGLRGLHGAQAAAEAHGPLGLLV